MIPRNEPMRRTSQRGKWAAATPEMKPRSLPASEAEARLLSCSCDMERIRLRSEE